MIRRLRASINTLLFAPETDCILAKNTSLNVDSISNNQHSQISFTLTSSGSAAANEIPDNNIDDDHFYDFHDDNDDHDHL